MSAITCDACDSLATDVYAGVMWFCAEHFRRFALLLHTGSEAEDAWDVLVGADGVSK